MWFLLAGCGGAPPAPPADGPQVIVSVGDPVVCPRATRAPWSTTLVSSGPRLAEAELRSAGLVVADLDGDGTDDVFLPHETRSRLVLQGADGAWTDVSARLDGLDLTDAVGGAAADVDADGDVDLFVTRWLRPNVLLANDGAGGFVDVTLRAGLGGTTDRHLSAAWADLDADTDLDLFVGSYGPQPSDDFSFDDPDLPPSVDRKHLYVNDGTGRFVERTELLPADLHDGYTFMASWLDTNGDRYPELFVWNDFGTAYPSRVLVNDGGRRFHAEPGTTGIDRPFEDMGVGVADLNADGLPDFATTSYLRLGLLLSTPSPNGAGAVWFDAAAARGLAVTSTQEFGWGIAFGDLDHDRDEDLVALFGYWSRYRDPREQPDAVWTQGADGGFTQVAPQWGLADPGVARGLVVADLDGDGFLDVLRRRLDGPTTLDRAGCDASAWSVVSLRHRSLDTRALGARVTAVSADGHRQTRWVMAGSQSMFSSGPTELHFGLAAEEAVDLEVRWPDGAETRLRHVPTRRRVTLVRE